MLAVGVGIGIGVLALTLLWQGDDLWPAASPMEHRAGVSPAHSPAECLEGIPLLDVEPGPAWRAHWTRLSSADCTPGSWLSQFQEKGQNLRQYQVGISNRVGEHEFLEVLPLGRPERQEDIDLAEEVSTFLGIFYQRDVVTSPPRTLPSEAFRPHKGVRGQYDAEALLSVLPTLCSQDAAACLAATDRDLFVEKLQYVFGLAHFRNRVGIFSSYRLWEKRQDQWTGQRVAVQEPEPLRRALKVASHEMAHEFGLEHCVHYKDCLMAGTNSLIESDRARLALCPLDHSKLQWNLGFTPQRRFSRLAEFARRHSLHPEARYWERMASEYPAWPNASGAVPLP